MIEGQSIGDPAAAIVPDEEEAIESQLAHDVDLVLRHDALRIVAVVGQSVGLAAVAIAAQIRGNDGEARRQLIGDLVPDRVRLRVTVQQQQARTGSTADQSDLDPVDADALLLETFKHVRPPLKLKDTARTPEKANAVCECIHAHITWHWSRRSAPPIL